MMVRCAQEGGRHLPPLEVFKKPPDVALGLVVCHGDGSVKGWTTSSQRSVPNLMIP